MIEKMTKYNFILLARDKEAFLSDLQELGVVDITRREKQLDARSSELFGKISSEKKLIGEIESGTDQTLARMQEKLAELRKDADNVRVWGEWDREAIEKTGIKIHFYCVAASKYDSAWENEYAIQIVEKDKNCWFVIAGDNESFPLKEIPAPGRSISEIEAEIKGIEAVIADYETALKARRTELPALRRELSVTEDEFARALASQGAESAAEDSLCIFEGFAPEENGAKLKSELDKMDIVWMDCGAAVEDNPPIKLKNNWFVRQFEVLTDMYGRPDYNEFDPTPYISVFFLLFFAMCMGDAGYGLLLIVIGILLKKVKGLADLSPLVTILGVGTFVVGIVMHTFFGVDISALEWVSAWMKGLMITGTIGGFEAQMVLSLVIGIIHLCLAMVVKTVYATRNKGFLGSLGIWGWTLLIVGGVVVGVLAMSSLLSETALKWTVIVLGVLSALGIFLFNDINRNPLKNIGSGLWETYNTVTGLLGDVLSYLRLYALGLAGGMLGKAFNDIATMTLGDGSFGFGWFAFALILIIGHALNLAMCCLGAFVHPLRLNFLEFFKNSGYDGKGRAYKPLDKTVQ